ncbi:hypothetical protein [Microcoleus sp. PH2017_25_DOB_D_A]|uniref:hypothetical protein n=1 Tax=Microcoleus sp. PH2017_25_DOB_D_A TaxID=2798835 RepID=UPI0025D4DB48|nr:hypothetical protein [Microcoleus sp. PH2017_25_DOB_D_A]
MEQASCLLLIMDVQGGPLVEQASCLLLIMDVQGGQDAHPTITLNSCGTGILPVANSQF